MPKIKEEIIRKRDAGKRIINLIDDISDPLSKDKKYKNAIYYVTEAIGELVNQGIINGYVVENQDDSLFVFTQKTLRGNGKYNLKVVKTLQCPSCEKKIEINWVMCPYCNYDLE